MVALLENKTGGSLLIWQSNYAKLASNPIKLIYTNHGRNIAQPAPMVGVKEI